MKNAIAMSAPCQLKTHSVPERNVNQVMGNYGCTSHVVSTGEEIFVLGISSGQAESVAFAMKFGLVSYW